MIDIWSIYPHGRVEWVFDGKEVTCRDNTRSTKFVPSKISGDGKIDSVLFSRESKEALLKIRA